MGRYSRHTSFLPTQTMKPYSKSEQFVPITRSMLYSEAYKSLTANELLIYQIMRIKFHKQEAERTEFEFSRSLGVKVLGLSSNSDKTIRRALKGLEKKGFIERTYISKGGGKINKKPNRYMFSEKWKTYRTNI